MKHKHRSSFVASATFAAALMSFSSLCSAAGDTTGLVTMLDINGTRVLVQLNIAPAGTRPDCATSTTYAGGFVLSAAGAQQFYAALLTAQATGTPVRIQGTNTCTAAGSVEDVSRLFVDND